MCVRFENTIDFVAGNSFFGAGICFWNCSNFSFGAEISVHGWCFGSNTVNCIIRYTGICMGVYVYLYAYCRIAYLDLYMGYMGRLYGLVLEVV